MSTKTKGWFHRAVTATEEAIAAGKIVFAENTLRRRGQSAEQDAATHVIDAKTDLAKKMAAFAENPTEAAENFSWNTVSRTIDRIDHT